MHRWFGYGCLSVIGRLVSATMPVITERPILGSCAQWGDLGGPFLNTQYAANVLLTDDHDVSFSTFSDRLEQMLGENVAERYLDFVRSEMSVSTDMFKLLVDYNYDGLSAPLTADQLYTIYLQQHAGEPTVGCHTMVVWYRTFCKLNARTPLNNLDVTLDENSLVSIPEKHLLTALLFDLEITSEIRNLVSFDFLI